MNFYIGNTIEDLKINDRNVEFSDDLLEYLNKNKRIFGLEEFVLQEIDPYDDTVIENSELQQWLSMCDSIVSSNILEQYEDLDETRSVEELIVLINEALNNNLNLIVIGDWLCEHVSFYIMLFYEMGIKRFSKILFWKAVN